MFDAWFKNQKTVRPLINLPVIKESVDYINIWHKKAQYDSAEDMKRYGFCAFLKNMRTVCR